MLFFDGECAFCHGGVKWFLAHDNVGLLRFAPIGGETWQQVAPAGMRDSPPNSLILVMARGSRPLTHSTGVLAAMGLLGQPWKRRAAMLSRIPRPLRDVGYRIIARIRLLIAGKAEGPCPVVAPELRARLLP